MKFLYLLVLGLDGKLILPYPKPQNLNEELNMFVMRIDN